MWQLVPLDAGYSALCRTRVQALAAVEAGCNCYSTTMGPITSTTVGPIINSKVSPTIDATTTTQSRIVTSLQYHPNPRITSLFFYRKFTEEAQRVEGALTAGWFSPMAAAQIRRAAHWRCAQPVLDRECGFGVAARAAVRNGQRRRLPPDRKGQHIPRAALGALHRFHRSESKRPWPMPVL